MMKLTVVFGSIALAVLFTVSSVSANEESYNLDGLWHVVGQDQSSTLNLKCWTGTIRARRGQIAGEGYSNFINEDGKSMTVPFKFWNPVPSPGNMAIISVSRHPERRFGSDGFMILSMVDENTMMLFNTYKIKKLKFKYVYLTRDISKQIDFFSEYPARSIDNNCGQEFNQIGY